MKLSFFIALILILGFSASAQVAFEPGYFIDEDGSRVNCLIKNTDKNINPTQFEYKLTEDSDVNIATISTVTEFEILNTVHKYKRFRVNIDRSSDDLSTLSTSIGADFKEEVLFLKVLLEGEATVYAYYERGGLNRFFLSVKGAEVQQLVYKRYYVTENNIKENNTYRSQLMTSLDCESISADKINKLPYEEKSLIGLVTDYNLCKGSEWTNYSERRKKGKLTFTVKAGVNSSALRTQQRENDYTKVKVYETFTNNFDRVTSPQVGFEVQYVIPFYKRKWSVFIEPTFQQYKQEEDEFEYVHQYSYRVGKYMAIAREYHTVRFKADYTHVALPIGIRHSYNLSETSRIFINGAICYNVLLNDSQIYQADGFESKSRFKYMDHFPRPSYLVGVGYLHNNRYSLEAICQFGKNVVHNENWKIDIQDSFSVVVGYRLF